MKNQTEPTAQNPADQVALQLDGSTQELTISFTQFRDLFKPRVNHFDSTGAWFGTAFAYFSEVSGSDFKKQYAHVETVQKEHPLKVWTIIDAEKIDDVVAVNRFVGPHQSTTLSPLGYILTDVPYDQSSAIAVNIFEDDC